MDFDWWIGFVLLMLLVILVLRSVYQPLFRRPDLVVEDTRIYSFVIWMPSAISMIAFIFSNHLVHIFHARHICNYQEILNVLLYTLPKIPFRCGQFNQFLILDKHDREIVILFDFFMMICFIIVFILIFILDKNPRNYERLKLNYSTIDPQRMKLSLRGILVLFPITFLMTFIYPLPFYSTEEWPIALLQGYGVGAFLQALIVSFGSFLMARAITMSRLQR